MTSCVAEPIDGRDRVSHEMVLRIEPGFTREVVMADDVMNPDPIVIPHVGVGQLVDREPAWRHFLTTVRLTDELFGPKNRDPPIPDLRMVIEDLAERLVEPDLDADLFHAFTDSRILRRFVDGALTAESVPATFPDSAQVAAEQDVVVTKDVDEYCLGESHLASPRFQRLKGRGRTLHRQTGHVNRLRTHDMQARMRV